MRSGGMRSSSEIPISRNDVFLGASASISNAIRCLVTGMSFTAMEDEVVVTMLMSDAMEW